MPSPRRVRGLTAAAVSLGLLAAVPAAASAASVTVTGDDGNPVAIAAGAGPTVRTMRPEVGVAFPVGEGRYRLSITNAAGAAVSTGVTCFSRAVRSPNPVTYTGNGVYTVTVTNFAADDSQCATPQSTEAYQFAIAAGISITPPAGPFLLRLPGSFVTNVFTLPVSVNPGASSHEVRFAAGASIGPDGGITGTSAQTSVDAATGNAQLRFPGPGVYTVVARPTRFTSAGEVGGPWSPPVQVVVAAPFDVAGGLVFLDSRGPSYSVRIRLREKIARGRVSIALARGTKGRYRALGSARISSRGDVSKRFVVRRTGTYRIRFSYRGAGVISGGRVTFRVRITRRTVFG